MAFEWAQGNDGDCVWDYVGPSQTALYVLYSKTGFIQHREPLLVLWRNARRELDSEKADCGGARERIEHTETNR